MNQLAYLLLGIKLFLLALWPMGMFTMTTTDFMHMFDQKSMLCMHDSCEQFTSANSAACLDHCINALKTDGTISAYLALPVLSLLIAVTILLNFYAPLASLVSYLRERDGIGKIMQKRFLLTVILRD